MPLCPCVSLFFLGGGTAMAYFVVQTKTGSELLAAAMLEQHLGLATYLPEVVQRRGGASVRRALFPGYLFVESEPAAFVRSAVDGQPGVVRTVAVDHVPCRVEATVVDALRVRVAAVNAQGGLPSHPYKPGDAVRLTRGPLAGLEAVFVGPTTPAERVEVLLRFLGRQQMTRVAPDELEAVANPVGIEERPRRTRGRGRPIRIKP